MANGLFKFVRINNVQGQVILADGCFEVWRIKYGDGGDLDNLTEWPIFRFIEVWTFRLDEIIQWIACLMFY